MAWISTTRGATAHAQIYLFLVLHVSESTCNFVDNLLALAALKIMAWRNCACADLSFLVLHISNWNFLHGFLFVPATISQAWVCSFHTKIYGNCTSTLSSLRSRRRYHRAQRDSICLSVICRLSVCHQTLPSLWDRSLPKFIFGFFRPLRGSVKIGYWPQSNPPPPTPPKMTPQNENFYFLTYWLEIWYITSWPLLHHKSSLESQLQGARLSMRRSISFSFVCTDLKFCR